MYRHFAYINIALLVCLSLLFPGAALAMPFQAAVSYTTGGGANGIAIGDFNSDGKPDLAVANTQGETISILIGRGDGTFNAAVNYTATGGPIGIAAGDFNGDGKLDLATANSGNDTSSVFSGNGDGTFNAAVSYAVESNPQDIVCGDFNGDGKPDLAVSNLFSGSVSILIGKGDGTFYASVNYIGQSQPELMAKGDFNGDGIIDLAVPNYYDYTVSILIGKGDGTFNDAVKYNTGENPVSAATGDFNRDGKLDLAITNYYDFTVSILTGKGDGSFNTPVTYSVGNYPLAITAGDFDGDGIIDLATANSAGNNISILTGKGNGTFNAAVNYAVGLAPHYVVQGDFNRDGLIDLAVSNHGGNSVSILLNTGGSNTASVNTSLGTVNINTDAGSISNAGWLAPADMRCSTPSGFIFPYGMFSFNINYLTAGQTATVTLRFPNPLPLGTKYYKCVNGNMVDCTSLVTRVDTNTLQIALTDGGLGDADGIANGVIVDPGGPAFPLSTPQSSSAQMPVTTTQAPVQLTNITVKSASLSASRVSPGTPVTVNADVANTGTGNGTSLIKVYVNGAEEAQQGVTVNSGSSTQVNFDISRSEPGTYTVYVGGTHAGSFTVDQFTPDTILFISGALVFFSLIGGVIWITVRRRA